MVNLLEETKDAIEKSGHKHDDIIFIGSEKSGHQCNWREFCKLADFDYEIGTGFGGEVAYDLIIVFSDGQRMWRGDDDGTECWHYSTPFKKPNVTKQIKSLFCSVPWSKLSEINDNKS